ncbi:hypothetical protein F3Y22_tig00112253pilonHSYRG00033 [Hibiscus syriacus]|uniref:RNase H type-1 domain-containing protein n=1 Tax=Hibiscus syriacus TaxID=106335 RepID=A0A6A2X2Q0_HIBSY|nr:hypothetical protein F3Y22_tig00112253pilonHSYRG00033 [Hibiscus syriacus]
MTKLRTFARKIDLVSRVNQFLQPRQLNQPIMFNSKTPCSTLRCFDNPSKEAPKSDNDGTVSAPIPVNSQFQLPDSKAENFTFPYCQSDYSSRNTDSPRHLDTSRKIIILDNTKHTTLRISENLDPNIASLPLATGHVLPTAPTKLPNLGSTIILAQGTDFPVTVYYFQMPTHVTLPNVQPGLEAPDNLDHVVVDTQSLRKMFNNIFVIINLMWWFFLKLPTNPPNPGSTIILAQGTDFPATVYYFQMPTHVTLPNVQPGCGHPKFAQNVQQYLRDHQPNVVAFLEPVSGSKVDMVIHSIGFPFSHRIGAARFTGRIWICLHDMRFQSSVFTWSRGFTSASLDRVICNSSSSDSFPDLVVFHLLHMRSGHRPLLFSVVRDNRQASDSLANTNSDPNIASVPLATGHVPPTAPTNPPNPGSTIILAQGTDFQMPIHVTLPNVQLGLEAPDNRDHVVVDTQSLCKMFNNIFVIINLTWKLFLNLSQPSLDFQLFLHDVGLHDMRLQSSAFTLSRGFTSARLDRVICNSSWKDSFPDLVVFHLLHMRSDHRPLLFSVGNSSSFRRNTQFRYFSGWLSHEDFSRIVRDNRQASDSLANTISGFTKSAELWNKTVFGYLGSKKKIVMAYIRGVQKPLTTQRTHFLINLESNLLLKLEKILDLEETLWKQRSQISGDAWRFDDTTLREAAVRFFYNLYSIEYSVTGSFPLSRCFLIIPAGEMSSFNAISTSSENHATLFDMSPLKALGHDGLYAKKIQTQWPIIGNTHGMPLLIAPNQTSFIHGRSISENFIINQEVTHSMYLCKKNNDWMAIKVNLEKTFNRIRWDFILDTLTDAGFSTNFINLIMNCITSSSMQVQSSQSFAPQCGIHQEEISDGAWVSFRFRQNGLHVSHLVFVDDMVLYAHVNVHQANIVESIISEFGHYSGHNVNKSKTLLYFSPNTETSIQCSIASRLGFRIINSLGKYIGRITLAKAALGATSVYLMQTMVLPKNIYNDIEKCIRWFICGSSNAGNKISLINWDVICQPRDQGGVGVIRTHEHNMAFLMKIGGSILLVTPYALSHIHSMKAPTANDIDDGIAWRWSHDHAFKLRAAYATLCDLNWVDTNDDLKFIWSLSIPQSEYGANSPTMPLALLVVLHKKPLSTSCAIVPKLAKLYGLGHLSSTPATRRTTASLVWRKLMSGWTCLNSVGGVYPSIGIGSAAEVIRNEEGAWIRGFSKNVGHSSILQGELWGIYEGLLAANFDVERLEIQTDCKQVVNLLKDPMADNCPISLVRAITTLSRQAWSTGLIWIPQGTNIVADSLTKMAPSSVMQMVLYETPPQAVESLLSLDKGGVSPLPVT